MSVMPKMGAFLLAHERARTEATSGGRMSQLCMLGRLPHFSQSKYAGEGCLFTFEEPLASVLLEKGLVDDRTGKVVNH